MPNVASYHGHRNSYTELNEVYFWTITVRQWIHLLKADDYKTIVMESLVWLCQNNLVSIYGYVIMPDHIHLLWKQIKMNGKEFPKNSFEKFTAHRFKKKLLLENPNELNKFKLETCDRQNNFWQRDPLAVLVFSREMASHKLSYMHFNPLQEHWQLVKLSEEYRFSSASFYETNKDEFGILTHYMEAF